MSLRAHIITLALITTNRTIPQLTNNNSRVLHYSVSESSYGDGLTTAAPFGVIPLACLMDGRQRLAADWSDVYWFKAFKAEVAVMVPRYP